MTSRVYNFALPYTITGLQDTLGVHDLKGAGLWDDVPTPLQAKLVAGEGLFSGGAVITKEQLDELPDNVWQYIADKLKLSWSKVT